MKAPKYFIGKRHKINKYKYDRIHLWLRNKYGKATHCSSKKCSGNSQKFEWALKKGKKYDYVKNNFIMLCHSCHVKMDLTPEGRKRKSDIRKLDLTGQKIGTLTVIEPRGKVKCGHYMWLCRCKCGKEKIVQVGNLRRKGVYGCQSCWNRDVRWKKKPVKLSILREEIQ